MRKLKLRSAALAALVFGLAPWGASAMWTRQEIPLVAGWNAIHVKVNPFDYGCAQVFGGGGIDQVSWWNRNRRDDGSGTVGSDMYAWYANNVAPSTFGAVLGDERYLVHTVAATNLVIFGTPALPQGEIFLGEQNLVGLNVPDGSVSCFDYFRDLGDQAATPYWAVSPSNVNQPLSDGDPIGQPSRAIWLQMEGTGSRAYAGPFEVTFDSSEKVLTWEGSTAVRSITVKNVSSVERVLHVALESSLNPPAGQGAKAGDVKVKVESIDWSHGYAQRVYSPLGSSFTTNLAAGATYELRIRPDLDLMPAASGDYLGILAISDRGSRIDGETRATGTCLYRLGVKASGQLAASTTPAGLWVGSVALNRVNRAPLLSTSLPEWNIDDLEDATQPFQFRIIVHVADDGTARLLKQAFVGTDAADDATAAVIADKATALEYRKVHPNATIRRVSSANFPYFEPKEFTSPLSFMQDGGRMSVTVNQDYRDKTNPFVHAFHPNHDNVAFNTGRPSWKGDSADGTGDYESWNVDRKITLTFEGTDRTGASGEDWNRTVCGGVYREDITGLTKCAVKDGKDTAIVVEGAFRLYKRLDTPEIMSGGVVR